MDNELKRAAKKAITRILDGEGRPGRLGRSDGTLYYTDANGKTYHDRVWVRLGSNEMFSEVVARCTTVPRQYGLPVIVATRNGRHEVLRADDSLALQFSGGRNVNVPEHAWVHSRLAPDPIYITGLQFLPFAPEPTNPPSMAIKVNQAFYRYKGETKLWKTGNSPDLSSYVPTQSGKQHFVIVCLDRVNNTLAIVDGFSAGSSDAFGKTTIGTNPFTVDDVASVEIPDTHLPIAAVRFYAGQTRILPVDIFMDMRLWAGEFTDVTVTSDPAVCQGRLTVTSNDPIGSGTDVDYLYYVPYKGNAIGLYVDGEWQIRTFSEKTIINAVLFPDANTNYDVFVYAQGESDIAFESVAWTDSATRSSELSRQDGILVKTGDATRRYIGTVRTDAAGKLTSSLQKRFVWNYYNRLQNRLVIDDYTTHTYDVDSFRPWNNDTSVRIEYVVGLDEAPMTVTLAATIHATVAGSLTYVSAGYDSTDTPGMPSPVTASDQHYLGVSFAFMNDAPGYHYWQVIERAIDDGGTYVSCNLSGLVEG